MERLVNSFLLTFLAGAVGFICSISLFAQHLPVKVYTSADGLGSGFVDYITSDSRGFMWFCTRDGLSRFDGSQFYTYRIGDEASPPGIEFIGESSDGAYWIATTGGMFRFDPNSSDKPFNTGSVINAEHVSEWRGLIFHDSRGRDWLASEGLFEILKKDGKISIEERDWHIPPKANTTFAVYEFAETADGSLWLMSSWGLIRRLPDERTVVYAYPNLTYGGAGVISMTTDKGGRLWIGLNNQLFILKPESLETFAGLGDLTVKDLLPTSTVPLKPESPYQLPKLGGEIYELTNKDFLEKTPVIRLKQTSDGDMWVTAEGNLLQFSGGTLYLHTGNEGLPRVMDRMAEDTAGNLWIGGFAGLARLNRNGFITYGPNDGSNSSRFFAITEAPDGTLYFGNPGVQISKLNGDKFEVATPVVDPNPSHLWTSRFVFIDSQSNWWILTNGKLYKYSGVKKFSELNGRKASKTFTTNDGFQSDGMYQIFEDSSGDIWVSTRGLSEDNAGVYRLKKGEEKFVRFGETEGLPRGHSSTCFVEDKNGIVWMGFYEGGFARFDGERFEYFPGIEAGPPTGLVTDMLVDEKGRLWMSSTNNGIFRIDDPSARRPLVWNWNTRNGLTSNNVRTIVADRFGRIYTGTARGVDRFSPDTGLFRHYSVDDGLAADFVVDSYCDRSGALWFATHNGLSKLNPRPEENAGAPQILLGGIKVAGNEKPLSQLGTHETNLPDLAANENNLQIDFFGLDFRAGETLRYQYKLEGADEDWSTPNRFRTVTYANLQPSTYRFFVRAVNSEGAVSADPAIVTFRILSPFYRRWWFIAGLALLITFIIVGFYRYRIARLREINAASEEARRAEERLRLSGEERLAELERLRSRIATDLHDDIGASLTQIAILSEVAQTRKQLPADGMAEPLAKITKVSNELVGTMSDIVWSINPSKDHLSDLTQRMRRFASDILSPKGIRFHFDAHDNIQDTILTSNLRREVFLIFKESINNVVKHAEANNVWVDLDIVGELLKLEIRDDGKGFDSSSKLLSEKGNGLASMNRRTIETGGNYHLKSTIGGPTIVSAIFPLDGSISITSQPNSDSNYH